MRTNLTTTPPAPLTTALTAPVPAPVPALPGPGPAAGITPGIARTHGAGRTRTLLVGLALASVAVVAGCSASGVDETLSSASARTSTKAGVKREAPPVTFTESEYGVSTSPRLAFAGSAIPKGGGHLKIGKPYKIRGVWYTPKDEPGYDRTGRASWYGPNFHGRKTANGEVFDQNHLSAAHTTFPLPSYARVTNVENGRSVVVRVNDRGPYSHKRIIDVSKKAAEVLGFKRAGTAKVRVEYVGRAPLEGDDMPKLLASVGEGKATMSAAAPVAVAAAEPRRRGLPGVGRIAPARRPKADVGTDAATAGGALAFGPGLRGGL